MFSLQFLSRPSGGLAAAPSQRPYPLHVLGSALDEPASSSPSAQPLLLLVEKDEAMRTMLSLMLSTQYRVEAVGDGEAACQAADRNLPDLVVIDLCIPGTDQLTAIRTLHADPRTAMLPIIMLTASIHRDLLLRCLTAGASNFLLKPFNMTDLLVCVRLELELRGTFTEPRPSPPAAVSDGPSTEAAGGTFHFRPANADHPHL